MTFLKWVRRSEHGEVLGPHAQKLRLTALGGSAGGNCRRRGGALDWLRCRPPDGLPAGKIAFVDYR